jgi:N6-adenosine-specific RNA methylase IME4
MAVEEICALPVKDWVEDEAVLFLWTTAPMLERSFEVVRAWGFTYKENFVWDKIKHNMGHYHSVRHEHLLICTRGSCQPDKQQLFDSVQNIERGKFSAKPVEFYDIIETLYTHGRKLELFARERRDGWDVYGHVAEIEAEE